MIMPGVGFGIVASDCLAMHVAERVPECKISAGSACCDRSPFREVVFDLRLEWAIRA